MDTTEENKTRAVAAESARDALLLVVMQLNGIAEGRSPYWEPGDIGKRLELAGIAARVAGDRDLSEKVLTVYRTMPTEPDGQQARETAALLKPLWHQAICSRRLMSPGELTPPFFSPFL